MERAGLLSNLALGLPVAVSQQTLLWCPAGAGIGTAIGRLGRPGADQEANAPGKS